MGYSPGKQQLFHRNECMHKRGVTSHMTIFHIMNTSDADGRRFNLAKRDCVRAAVRRGVPQSSPNILISERGREGQKKRENDVPDSHKWPRMTLIEISAPRKTAHSHRVMKMMRIRQWQDRNCAVVLRLPRRRIYMSRPQRHGPSSSSILTQRAGPA